MPFNSPIPLQTLLELLPPETYVWLSGEEKAASTLIGWISQGVLNGKHGDLLILSEDESRGSQVDVALRGDAAAIGLIGVTEVDSTRLVGKLVIRFVVDQAHKSDPEQQIRAIHQLLLRALMAQKSILLERGANIQTRLTQIAARGEGLAGLAGAMREMTQHGILVQDKRLSPLASSPSPDLRSIWSDLLEQLAELSTLPEILRDRRQAGETPAVSAEPLPGGLERMIAPIVVGDVARGYLTAIGMQGELDQTDRMVLEQGALVCAIEMARAKAVRETEKRLHGDLLSALLHQNLSARDAHLWAQNMGLDLDQRHTAVRMAWEGPSPTLRRLETLVNGEVSQAKSPVIVSSLSGEIICFCETPREAGKPATAIALAQSVIELAGKEFPDSVIRCGVGTPATDLGAWQLSFRQAGQALDMARRLNERKPLYYMDLSVYRLLLEFEDNPEMKAFLQETLGPILAHENSDEFLATLEEFFNHNGNLSQTAEALFIHRNTLTYRMERMTSISRLDLDNPDTRLAVQLALSIRRMLKAA
jgi:purine catabolism regulator